MRCPLEWVLCMLFLVTHAVARADDAAQAPTTAETCAEGRYVTLTAQGGFDALLLAEVQKDLAAELASHALCVRTSPAAGGAPAAEIVLQQRDEALVMVQVDDHATDKRAARDVSLRKIPSSGVALAIAIAIDELLRAGWAELMLRPRAEPAVVEPPKPSAPTAVTPREPPPPEAAAAPAAIERRWGLGLFGEYAYGSKRWDAFALSLRASLRPLRFLLLEAGVAGHSALDVKTRFGTARGRGLGGLLSLAGCLDPLPRLSVCAGGRASLEWTQFRGQQPRNAKAGKHAATSLVLAGLLAARVQLLPQLRLIAEASLGGVPRAAQATAADQVLLGTGGLRVSTGLGLELAL